MQEGFNYNRKHGKNKYFIPKPLVFTRVMKGIITLIFFSCLVSVNAHNKQNAYL